MPRDFLRTTLEPGDAEEREANPFAAAGSARLAEALGTLACCLETAHLQRRPLHGLDLRRDTVQRLPVAFYQGVVELLALIHELFVGFAHVRLGHRIWKWKEAYMSESRADANSSLN